MEVVEQKEAEVYAITKSIKLVALIRSSGAAVEIVFSLLNLIVEENGQGELRLHLEYSFMAIITKHLA